MQHARVLSIQVGPANAAHFPWRAWEQHTEWLELRLDAWLAREPVSVAELESWLRSQLRQRVRPCLVTIHDPSAMGEFVGSDELRLEYLRAAVRAGADAIDVPQHLAAQLGSLDGAARRIVSWHGPSGSAQALRERCAQLRALAGPQDWIKLVPQAQCAEDGLALLEALREEPGPCIGFASGVAGRFTRLLAPLYGSRWSYCSSPRTHAAPATAAGQFACDEIQAWWPAQGVDASTLVFGVVGNPARHSASPRLFTECFRAAGANALYLDFEAREWHSFRQAIEAAGLPWAGFSITAPFKTLAQSTASVAARAARDTQAVNTLVRLAGPLQRSYGDNTDVQGARRLWCQALTAPSSVVVFGSGGAARAAILAARELGHQVLVCARNAARAQALAQELGVRALPREQLQQWEYAALLHATPLGSHAAPDACALQPEEVRAGAWILDAVYRPRDTPLRRLALARGARYLDGVAWFLAQAAAQWELWTAAGSALEAQGVECAELQRIEACLQRALERHEQGEALAAHRRSTQQRPLCLIGLRAAGKSTLAPALAQRLGWACVDLDRELERVYAQEHWPAAALECGAILELLGEPVFRALETRVLHEVLARAQPQVIASGGGVVESEENRQALAQHADCVWLDGDPKLLVERMAQDRVSRPSLLGLPALEELECLAKRRRAWYRELATVRVDAAWTTEQACAALVEVLGLSRAGA